MAVYIGLDIGGTKFLVAAADQEGRILRRVQKPTPYDRDEGIALLMAMADEVAAGEEIAAFGAAVGGPLDWQRGIVSPLHQPTWRDVPLKQIFEERYNCPLYLDVDTNVAALGEYRFGGETARRLFYMTVSTGIGGGYVIDGKLYRGMDGAHPEVGHQGIAYRCMHPENITCECGAPDCLEALVSGNGIQRIYGKKGQELNEEEWAEVGYNLGQGLRNIATIYLPDVIVLGGGVVVGGADKLLPAIDKVLKDNLFLVPIPKVKISNLGYETALQGCIALALYPPSE